MQSATSNPGRRVVHTLAVCACIVLAGALITHAGPLDPPAGPVAPTYKTLSEVEPRTPISSLPYTITQPGSYYLTRNLTGVAGNNGISILASNVTIDLNGFTLDGNGNTGFRAISCSFRSNVTIRNGTIANWNREGIDGYQSHQARVEDVTVDNSNNGFGIIVSYTSVVTRCQVRSSAAGIIVGDGSTVANCTAESNQRGFEIGAGSSVSECAAVSNTGNGFDIGAGVTARDCTARGNVANGFQTGASNTLVNCTSNGNAGKGFQMDGAGQLLDSTSSGNTGAGVDITVPGGGNPVVARVDGCSINFNGGHGLSQAGGGGSTFSNNTIARNSGAGIAVLDGNLIINNRIVDNGAPANAAGVQVNGSQNTIQGNNILNNGVMYSFAVGTSANLFFGNTCRGGAQFNSGSNTLAPFVNAGTAFSGASLANTNSFVNILY
jgi:hypothetical protein